MARRRTTSARRQRGKPAARGPAPAEPLPVDVRLDPAAPPGDVVGALAALILRRARAAVAEAAPTANGLARQQESSGEE
jgi:hypothetical protein